MPVDRFTAQTWRESPQARRRFDLSRFAAEREVVVEICAAVAEHGDEALRLYGKRFEGWAPGTGESFAVPKADIDRAVNEVPPADRAAIELAARRIHEFHSLQRAQVFVGPPDRQLLVWSVHRAGVYAPGGRATYPSTVLMTAIPAVVAAVAHVALATPPRSDGSVAPALLAAARIAGVETVYRMGGAQAIAALAYGTATVPRVDVIAGPGNIYVTLAKKEVFGAVGIDGLAGPTEIAIIADASARPDFVAADLAAQLEHDPLAVGVLFTDSKVLAQRVEEELSSLVGGLERAEIIRRASCSIVVVDDLGIALELADEFAPEHLLIVSESEEELAGQIQNAGAVFVGPYSTVPLGDYIAGPNHTLPTSGTARFGSPLGVYTFQKRSSLMRFGREDLTRLRDAAVRLATLEGLGAHAHAIEVRLE